MSVVKYFQPFSQTLLMSNFSGTPADFYKPGAENNEFDRYEHITWRPLNSLLSAVIACQRVQAGT